MSIVRHFTYLSNDKATKIHAMEWRGKGPVRAILQIAHGMQEFIDRYDDFARFLADQGFLVVGNDHLGHGASIRSEEMFGYFAPKSPERVVLADMRELHRRTQEAYPEVPYFLLGHSMGSFFARAYVCIYGKYLDGAIISGTAYHSSFEALSGMLMCRVMARLRGWMYRSPMMTMIVMGGFNKRFEPARTKVDWLTRDEKIVDAYRADKRCHFMFTLNGYYGMFRVLKLLTEQRRLARMPVHLPLFFIAGEMDPVGNFGDGVKRVVVQLRTLGADRIECRLYPNDRHEVLNELNRSEVYKDVLEWLEKVMPRK